MGWAEPEGGLGAAQWEELYEGEKMQCRLMKAAFVGPVVAAGNVARGAGPVSGEVAEVDWDVI